MARPTPISRPRGSGSFRRGAGRKQPRSITLIVCEGETEQRYFDAARIKYELTTAEIVLPENTVGPAPISVVECAEKKCSEQGGYDNVFCVFDRDGHESFDRARDKITKLASRKRKALPMKEAISIPCFELWVLLHFERMDAPFQSCAKAIERVQKHLLGYKKANAAIAKQLMKNVEAAIGNAEWLEKRTVNNNHNPYTSVHRVLRHFSQVANQ